MCADRPAAMSHSVVSFPTVSMGRSELVSCSDASAVSWCSSFDKILATTLDVRANDVDATLVGSTSDNI